MPISINVNIDRIDKKKFVTGKKGRYLDLVLWETPDSEFGDYLVKQRGNKGDRLPILGNGKYFKPESKGKTDEDRIKDRGDDPW